MTEQSENIEIAEKSIVLQASKKSQIPKNAVIVSKEIAISHRLKQIYSWRPKSDLWAVRYGSWILAAISVVPSVYITQYYRRKLKLRQFGYYTMYMGLVYGPSILSGSFHYQTVTLPLVAMNQHDCPICIEARAGAMQCIFSIIYPICLAGASGLMFATRHGTVDLPYYKDYKGILQRYKKLSMPLFKTLFLFAAAQLVCANFITYMEANQIFKFHEKHLNAEIKKAGQEKIMSSS